MGSNKQMNWEVFNKLLSKGPSSTPDEFFIDDQAAKGPQKIGVTFCDHFINK